MTDTETYLGYNVFASFDGYQIWLRTCDGNAPQIALDSAAFNALVEYVTALRIPTGDKQ